MEATIITFLNITWQVGTLALLALGLAIVFGLLRVMNMAHGEFVMIGAYAPVVTSSLGLPDYMALLVCLVTVGIVALIVERLVVRHLYNRLFDSLLATWGVSILLRELVELIFGRSYQSVALPIEGVTRIAGVGYPTYRLVVIALLILGFGLLWLWYRKSLIALKVRAMVSNPALAKSIGVNTDRLSSAAFVTGCLCAGLAGLVLAPTIRVEPLMGLDALLRSFFSLVIGGMGSLEGLWLGTGIVGGVQGLLGAFYSQTAGYLGVLILAILFLWAKPNGLYRRR